MNLTKKDVLRLKDVLIQQLADLLEDDQRFKSIAAIASSFRYQDYKDSEHTPEHGMSLTIRQTEYLIEQSEGLLLPPDDKAAWWWWRVDREHRLYHAELPTPSDAPLDEQAESQS